MPEPDGVHCILSGFGIMDYNNSSSMTDEAVISDSIILVCFMILASAEEVKGKENDKRRKKGNGRGMANRKSAGKRAGMV